MAIKSLILCKSFLKKLAALYECSGAAETEVRIENDASLARALKAPDSRISTWRNGDPTKGRGSGEIAQKDLRRLCALLSEATGGRLSKSEAWRLWKDSSAAEFRRRLSEGPSSSIFSILTEYEPELEILFYVAEDGLRMVDEMLASRALSYRARRRTHRPTGSCARSDP